MTYTRVLAVIVSLALGSSAVHAQSTTVLNDTFADSERVTQNPPTSLAWYAPGAAVNTLGVRNGMLTLVANDNDRLIWGVSPGANDRHRRFAHAERGF